MSSRKNPNDYSVDLRGVVSQLNIQGARSTELLELLRELQVSGDHDRMGRLMDQHVAATVSFIRLSEQLTNELLRRFDDDE